MQVSKINIINTSKTSFGRTITKEEVTLFKMLPTQEQTAIESRLQQSLSSINKSTTPFKESMVNLLFGLTFNSIKRGDSLKPIGQEVNFLAHA